MSDEKVRIINRPLIDGDVVFWFGIFLLIILFAGEPDLMDVIIERIQNGTVQVEEVQNQQEILD